MIKPKWEGEVWAQIWTVHTAAAARSSDTVWNIINALKQTACVRPTSFIGFISQSKSFVFNEMIHFELVASQRCAQWILAIILHFLGISGVIYSSTWRLLLLCSIRSRVHESKCARVPFFSSTAGFIIDTWEFEVHMTKEITIWAQQITRITLLKEIARDM
jgi:hypothetical protein